VSSESRDAIVSDVGIPEPEVVIVMETWPPLFESLDELGNRFRFLVTDS
jgi:hypothetical protein